MVLDRFEDFSAGHDAGSTIKPAGDGLDGTFSGGARRPADPGKDVDKRLVPSPGACRAEPVPGRKEIGRHR